MDHDNKVTGRQPAQKAGSAHRSVRLFLAKELAPLEERRAVNAYNLAEEYAKTQKNRNRRVWVLLAICFAAVILAASGITLFVSRADKRIEINIDSFDDLNLRSLLSSVGRTQSMYEAASKNRASLQASLDAELKAAEQKRDNDLFTMQSVAAVSTQAAIRRKAEAVEKEYQATIQRLHEEYDTQIQAAENEMQLYSAQLEDYDGAQITRAQEQAAAIDSERQLHSLEMKNQAARYEKQIADLRDQMAAQQRAAQKAQQAAVEEVRRIYQAKIDELDPFVRDARGNQVVQQAAAGSAGSDLSFKAADFAAGSGSSARTLSDALADTQEAFEDFDYITHIVAAIPQERDIPSFVQAMKNKTYQIGSTLAKAAKSLQQEADGLRKNIADLEQQVHLRDSWFDAYLTENLCDGLVLDASNKARLPVRLTKAAAQAVAQGTVQAQIRDGKKVIADVTIELRGDTAYALPQNPAQAEHITAFAKLHLLQPEAKKK